ncbi:MAG: DNA replication/repair protein RecF [Legionellaceae bacterium]
MSIARLDIHHVRNLLTLGLTPHPRYNVFYGQNGSGKTSLLESVYLLSSGRSFRTRDVSSLIATHTSSLVVFAKTTKDDVISIEKSKAGTTVRVNQHPCLKSSELALLLPCQVFYQDIFDIINAGPSVRRSVLDWGLFHVKQSYRTLLKDYRKILKHRNALLKQKASFSEFEPWNKQLAVLSEALDEHRSAYVETWSVQFSHILSLLTDFSCSLSYEKGWDKKKTGQSLEVILKQQFEQDIFRQTTHSGAHHADLMFDVHPLHVKQNLSRGQQKVILIALKLAQAQLLNQPCLYLFDDMTSELDLKHVERFLSLLDTIEGQFYFTSIQPDVFCDHFEPSQASFFALEAGTVIPKMFHVKHSTLLPE